MRILILYHSFLSGDVVCFFVVYKANKRGSIFWKAVVVPFVELPSHQSLDDLILSFSCLRLHVFWIFWSNLGTRYSRGASLFGFVPWYMWWGHLIFPIFYCFFCAQLLVCIIFSNFFFLWVSIFDSRSMISPSLAHTFFPLVPSQEELLLWWLQVSDRDTFISISSPPFATIKTTWDFLLLVYYWSFTTHYYHIYLSTGYIFLFWVPVISSVLLLKNLWNYFLINIPAGLWN